jgi:hypothetical protein
MCLHDFEGQFFLGKNCSSAIKIQDVALVRYNFHAPWSYFGKIFA